MQDRLKCPICEHTVPRFRRSKNGRTRHGSSVLMTHISYEHPEQHRRIQAQVAQDYHSDPETLEGKGS